MIDFGRSGKIVFGAKKIEVYSIEKTFRECINIRRKNTRTIDHLLSESGRVFHP